MEFEVLGNKDTRSGFGEGLAVLGEQNPDVVALCADLTGSLKMDAFQKAHPGFEPFLPALRAAHPGGLFRGHSPPYRPAGSAHSAV